MSAVTITRNEAVQTGGYRTITLRGSNGHWATVTDSDQGNGHLVYGDFYTPQGANVTSGLVYKAGYSAVSDPAEIGFEVLWREQAARAWLAAR